MGLPPSRPASRLLLGPDAPGLGAAPRPTHTQPGSMGFPAIAGAHLPGRLRVALGADHRPGGSQWHSAGVLGYGRHATQCGRRTPRPESLPPGPDVMLVQSNRRLPEVAMCRRGDASRPACHRHRPRPMSVPAVADIPFAGHGLPGIPGLSVGQSAAGDGLPRHLPGALAIVAPIVPRRPALAPRAVAAAVAVVQTDVPVRLRQTVQWRPRLAEVDGAHLPLRDPAAADVDRVVCAPIA